MPNTKKLITKNYLRQYRIRSLMSRSALAKLSGVSRKTIVNIESQRHFPQGRIVAKLLTALNMTHEQVEEIFPGRGKYEEDEQKAEFTPKAKFGPKEKKVRETRKAS